MEETQIQSPTIEMIKPKERVFELDLFRGIAVLAMIIDHFTILLLYSSGYDGWAPYIFSNYNTVHSAFLDTILKWITIFQDSQFRLTFHYIFVTIFLLISGISCSFSHSNLKRSIKIIIAGLIITVATTILSLASGEDLYIIFGILSTLGVSILLYHLCMKIFPNRWFILILGIGLIGWGFLIEWWNAPRLNTIQDLNFSHLIKVILGYEVYGQDHFGILPCTGVLFVGAFIGQTFYFKRKSLIPKLNGKWTKPFCYIGRHALWIYLLHQVVAVIIIVVLYILVGYRF